MVEAIRKAEPCVVGIHRDDNPKTSGTGIIIDKSGLIVTNHHVIDTAKTVYVRLRDDSKVPGEILLDRPESDLAFIRIRPDKDLPAIPPRKEKDLLVGETVIAIGHPYGYTDTVSAGIVSALNRQIDMPRGVVLRKLIQTNATINPGN